MPVTYLFNIRFDTAAMPVGEIPGGTRIVVNVVGGQFHGPALRGTVTAGSDWVVRRPVGPSTLDVRAQLHTEDDVTILMSYNGLATPDPHGVTRVIAQVRFEAPAQSRYAWLNDDVCVAMGATEQGSVTYRIYALRWMGPSDPTQPPTESEMPKR